MSNLKSGISLLEGEKLLIEIENNKLNLIAMIIFLVLGLGSLIIGIGRVFWIVNGSVFIIPFIVFVVLAVLIYLNRPKRYLVVTNKRVIEVLRPSKKLTVVKDILPHSINEIGYTRQKQCCSVVYKLNYKTLSHSPLQQSSFLIKVDSETEAEELKNTFRDAVIMQQKQICNV